MDSKIAHQQQKRFSTRITGKGNVLLKTRSCFTESFEGCRLTAYEDPFKNGLLTVSVRATQERCEGAELPAMRKV
jgi:hypothetical protein